MRYVEKTNRTALVPGGKVEAIYLVWHDEGIFAGVTSEVLESDLTEAERESYDALPREDECPNQCPLCGEISRRCNCD